MPQGRPVAVMTVGLAAVMAAVMVGLAAMTAGSPIAEHIAIDQVGPVTAPAEQVAPTANSSSVNLGGDAEFEDFMAMATAGRFRARWRPELGDAAPDAAMSEQQALPEHCELAVVGAGWGGVYAAWRLAVDDGSQLKPEDVCVFEASGRVGGRIMSVHNIPGFEDMTIDVGGYRFGKNDTIVAQLIQERLKIPTICYDFGLSPDECPMFIVRECSSALPVLSCSMVDVAAWLGAHFPAGIPIPLLHALGAAPPERRRVRQQRRICQADRDHAGAD